MGRMHSNGKGISSSALPFRRQPPKWITLSPAAVVELIVKLAKKGTIHILELTLMPFQVLPPVKSVSPWEINTVFLKSDSWPAERSSESLRRTVGEIMKKVLIISTGCAPQIPEDLYNLIKKAVSIRKHLERNRKDTDAKFRLILVESRIHRLSRYFRKTGQLPPTWK